MDPLKKFCEGKEIAIVGNSSKLLKFKFGPMIDSHDIVVRINNAPKYISKYPENIGTKTTIMSYGMSRLEKAKILSKICNPYFNLFPVRCSKIKDYRVYDGFKNPYFVSIEDYNELKKKFPGFKPSTGACTVNFFVKNISFKRLSLFGFDFFTSSSRLPNEFNSFLHKDHSPEYEKKYIQSILSDKVVIY